VVVYDHEAIVEQLVADGMEEDEVLRYISSTILG